MLTFTPLSGPYVRGPEASSDTERAKALAYLIETDNARILLDCGAPEDFTFEDIGVAGDGPLSGSLPDILARYAGPEQELMQCCAND